MNAPARPILLSRTVAGALALVVASGCKDGVFDWSFLFPEDHGSVVDDTQYTDHITSSASYRDTVAELAYFDGMRRLRVRGYGVVAGLRDQGSEQCPPRIMNQLIQDLYKRPEFTDRTDLVVTPQRLITDKDTAVVLVEGEIPAAAVARDRFDLVVRAVPGDQTLSLEGGQLYPCRLTIFRSVGGGAWIPGKEVADAAGPIFINPFAHGEDAATKPNRREGVVIGGGVAFEDRRVRLLLTIPSYQRAVAIARRINERFPQPDNPVADALSPTEIRIVIPDSFRHEPRRFLAVAQHVYLPQHTGFMSQRLAELAREFVRPDAPHEEIALAWEAAGRTALPVVQNFYTHDRPACSFYSAQTGLRLGDDVAVEAIDQHLNNPKSPHRMEAIQTLAAARGSIRAARPLRTALSDEDARIRVAAYHALVDRNDDSVASFKVGSDGFLLDVVRAEGKNMVYATRREQRRIALIGGELSAIPPLFYVLPSGALSVEAEPGAEYLTLIRQSPNLDLMSPPIKSSVNAFRLIPLLGADPPSAPAEPIMGLGLSYTDIVLLMSDLCRNGSFNADFMLESADNKLLPSPMSKPGRPETSEL
jgi:hypothetical protein